MLAGIEQLATIAPAARCCPSDAILLEKRDCFDTHTTPDHPLLHGEPRVLSFSRLSSATVGRWKFITY